MSQPKIELVPLKPAVRSDADCTLDVLVRITPAVPQTALTRPALNLGLVLDRSGSMDGRNKLTFDGCSGSVCAGCRERIG